MSAAPGVRLVFSNGHVWLAANGATVGQILAEWAHTGGTRIVNGDIASQPLTAAPPDFHRVRRRFSLMVFLSLGSDDAYEPGNCK